MDGRSNEAKNLEAISKAIDQHEANCGFPAVEIAMNPFEVERLGWDEILGLRVVGDGNLGTGTFHVRCQRDLENIPHAEKVEERLLPAGVVD